VCEIEIERERERERVCVCVRERERENVDRTIEGESKFYPDKNATLPKD
jgi:hypothetical protein